MEHDRVSLNSTDMFIIIIKRLVILSANRVLCMSGQEEWNFFEVVHRLGYWKIYPGVLLSDRNKNLFENNAS